MIRLKSPQIELKDVIQDCIYNFRDSNKKESIEKIIPEIEKFHEKYREYASKNELHLFKDPFASNNDLNNILVGLYTNKLSKINEKARNYYNLIMNYTTETNDVVIFSDEFKICPLCQTTEVNTLDHYLPKTKFPSLAVSPLNLIPICSKCNKNKSDYFSENAHSNLLHIYFDDISESHWLKSNVKFSFDKIENFIMDIDFFVDASAFNNKILLSRVEMTFNKYNIGQTYEILAKTAFNNQVDSFLRTFIASGEDKLKEDIYNIIKHYNDENRWEYVFYNEIISQNTWPSIIKAFNKYIEFNKNV
ncbi:HNH endonuclease [Staphylococcus aureus]|uniref:HNH endonuclease n=4 Tax=Staphylococcus aureus TaxID=1280 RepID=UPI000CD25AFA|nr:HNH endonuclease [Staphylococcus aureus]